MILLLLRIYFEFFKIGLFAAGGGIAMVPFLYQLSIKTAWFSAVDIIDIFAISGITPGALGVNMTTFAGYRAAGPLGAAAAVLGLATPSVILMIVIANILKKFMNNKYAQNAFKGMSAAVCALISAAIYKIITDTLFDLRAFEAGASFANSLHIKATLFFIILLFAIRRYKAHPFLYICISAAVGLVIKF